MNTKSLRFLFAFTLAVAGRFGAIAQDALPSWNDGAPKKAIRAFVKKVTQPGSPDFVPPAERVAVFVGGWALQQLWLFWLAPLIGAGVAGVVYPIMAGRAGEK